MLLRMRAWDIMREDFLSVREDATLADVVRVLRTAQKTDPDQYRVLVLAMTGDLVGVITAWDILRKLENSVLQDDTLRNIDDMDWDNAFDKACIKRCGEPINRIMHKNVPTVKPNEPLLLALNSLVDSKRNWVAVVEGGRPLGVIMVSDIFREMTRKLC